MKQATIIDLNGHVVDVTLVEDNVIGVFPIYVTPSPNVEGVIGEAVLTGYQIAIKPPDGLYKPTFDIDKEEWSEGLTQEEIDALHVPPTPSDVDILGAQLVERELQIMELQAQLEFVGGEIVNNDLRLLALEGGGVI